LLDLGERHTFTVETCRQLGTSEFRRIDDAWRVIACYGHDHDKRPTCG
jgi:hypothetical protein